MHYTDEELKRWWKGLSKSEIAELFGRMIEKMDSDFGLSLSRQWESGRELSAKQIQAIRKWHRD